jgi:hypothetical protein
MCVELKFKSGRRSSQRLLCVTMPLLYHACSRVFRGAFFHSNLCLACISLLFLHAPPHLASRAGVVATLGHFPASARVAGRRNSRAVGRVCPSGISLSMSIILYLCLYPYRYPYLYAVREVPICLWLMAVLMRVQRVACGMVGLYVRCPRCVFWNAERCCDHVGGGRCGHC